MVTSIRFRIWFRTLRFFAYNWAFPFFLGLAASLFFQAQLISEVALAFDAALSDANLSGGPCNTATLSPRGEFPSVEAADSVGGSVSGSTISNGGLLSNG